MTSFVKYKNRRYRVHLPEKEQHNVLSDNYKQSQTRLKGIWKKFSTNKELFENNNYIIQEQKSKQVIEKAPEQSITGRTHYIPFRPVVDERKSTTKVRMTQVQKKKGVSL